MNHKRKKCRLHMYRASRHTRFPDGTPSYWNLFYNIRPRRRRNKAGCHKILRDADAEGIVWDLGNHRPHIYFW